MFQVNLLKIHLLHFFLNNILVLLNNNIFLLNNILIHLMNINIM